MQVGDTAEHVAIKGCALHDLGGDAITLHGVQASVRAVRSALSCTRAIGLKRGKQVNDFAHTNTQPRNAT